MGRRHRGGGWLALALAGAHAVAAQAQEEDYCSVFRTAVEHAPSNFWGLIGAQQGYGLYDTTLYLPEWAECSVLERNARWAWYCHGYGESGRGYETGLWVFEEIGRCFPEWAAYDYDVSTFEDPDTTAAWDGGWHGEGVQILVTGYDDVYGDSGVTLTVSLE